METYLNSINKGFFEVFEQKDNVLILGEDILDPYGGAFKVTKGLSDKFPEKVIATPISEAAIVGVGIGLALQGYRPIVEIMFGDFMSLTVDQVLNSASKFGLMYGEEVNVPLLIRTPMGGGRGYGPTHSQSIEKLFFGMPGVTVVSPSLAHDVKKLFIESVEDDEVTIFIEGKDIYTCPLINNKSGSLNINEKQIGKNSIAIVDNFSSGLNPDICIFSYGSMSQMVNKILEDFIDEEINIRVFYPSIINNLDFIKEINQLNCPSYGYIICEPGAGAFGWNADVLKAIYESKNFSMDKKIICLSSDNSIIPAAKELEEKVLVNIDNIKLAINELIQ